ncbi:hypothetical protein GDO81_011909 [Engystomops pustulosus]|uniref:Uncharacterized protein n=1 Tax=Engystomops pustulosus TaxID=76066 RepID=A0AAV7BHL7_ENGPU|nr:hypothetical protein GDO81_011909 [Engystomops pustulosus]
MVAFFRVILQGSRVQYYPYRPAIISTAGRGGRELVQDLLIPVLCRYSTVEEVAVFHCLGAAR